MSQSVSELPGPGLYSGDLNTFGKDGKKIALRGKSQRNDHTISPGPGAYDSKLHVIKEHQASFRMASSERKTTFGNITSRSQGDDQPGPGMYNPKLPPGRSVIFDKDEKERG